MTPYDYRHVITTTIKDEGPYILDWVAYHLAIGFSHFVVMGNDNSDGGDTLVRHLEKLGLATYAENRAPYAKGIQKTAYGRMRRFDAVQQADWLLTLDLDEYFRIDLGGGTLGELIEALGDGVAMSFVWQNFGHNGVREIVDVPIIEQFTRSSHDYLAQPYQARGLKTLYRADAFARIGTHRPIDPRVELSPSNPWYDGDFRQINGYAQTSHWCAWNNGYAFGTKAGRINHYALRSKDALLLKLQRGFSNRANYGMRGADDPITYWRTFDWNTVENTRILRHLDAANAIKAELLAVPQIAKWHQFAVEHHQTRAISNRELLTAENDSDPLAHFARTLDTIEPQKEIAELAGTGLLNPHFPTMFDPSQLAQIANT